MALVKTTKITPPKAKPAPLAKPAAATAKPQAHSRPLPGKATITERVAAATEQLASGITQSATAAEELRRSMEQIAAGAEESAGASQEQLAAIKRIIANLGTARGRAADTRRQPRRHSLFWQRRLFSLAIPCARSSAMPSVRPLRWT